MERIGFTQQAVLTSLAAEDRSVRTIAYDWPWLTESSVRSAVKRLEWRGLVDVAGWDGQSRTYKITDKGLTVLDSIGLASDEDDPSEYARA